MALHPPSSESQDAIGICHNRHPMVPSGNPLQFSETGLSLVLSLHPLR